MSVSENQKTITQEVYFSGKALQSGEDVKVTCKPSPPDSGIVLCRADLDPGISLRIGDVLTSDSSGRRSTLSLGDATIQTVEHFLAALWGLEIDNVLVEVHGVEFPGMDGSALGFMEELKKAGIKEQSGRKKRIKILEELTIGNEDAAISVVPYDGFCVSYLIDYDCTSIKREEFCIDLDIQSFEKEIAPARTFCLESEAMALLEAGLGKGATYENTLVMGEDGPIGTALRFSNEPVRHKILDLVGDLYLLGVPVTGKIIAKKSGHRLNAEMVKKLYERYVAEN